MITEFAIGQRVIRGPDWDRGDEDGGPGNTGTVTGIAIEGIWVYVEWPTGKRTAHQMKYTTKRTIKEATN